MTSRQDELHLIQRLVARDRGAWCQFVQSFQGLVFARVRRTALECNRQLAQVEAEDICADVFMRLVANDYASLRRFEGRSSLATWLSVIARRVCLRHLQKPRVRQIDTGDAQETIADRAADTDDALAGIIAREDTARLHKMLDELSAADQQVLRWYYLDELGYREISQRLQISTNTVGPKIHRAQQRLKRIMEEQGPTREERGCDE